MNILVVVDMQKGFINKNNEFLIKNIEKLAKNANFDKIIATKFVNQKNSHYEKYLSYSAMQIGDECEFAVRLPEETIVVQKTSYGFPLKYLSHEEDLFEKGDTIYLCGTDTDACVLAIAYQLFDLGFEVKIVSDAIGSSAKEPLDRKYLDRIFTRNFGKNCIIDSKML